MKKRTLLIISALMILITVIPADACTIERTSESEYYLYYREYPELRVYENKGLDAFNYEGNAPRWKMFEDGGFDTGEQDDESLNSITVTSSNPKILSIDSAFWCAKPGDVNVTIKQGTKTKVNKVHVYDLKLKPVYKTSKKAVLKTKGNLKGCTAVLKIGKKTYKKKITKKNQILKFKIKKPSAGKKITVRILKGKKELFMGNLSVLFQKKIKKGMSIKRAKQTYEYEYNRFAPKKTGNREIWKFGKVKVILKNNKVQKVIRR